MFAALGIGIAKFIGGHLIAAHVNRAATGASNTLEAMVTGLGARFALGFGTAFYLTNGDFRTGANMCVAAVRDAIATPALNALRGLF